MTIDRDLLHRNWLLTKVAERRNCNRSKLIGFETLLKSYRSHNRDSTETFSRVNLPFQLQTQIDEKYNIGSSDSSAKAFHSKLRGQNEQYGTVHNVNLFEIR